MNTFNNFFKDYQDTQQKMFEKFQKAYAPMFGDESDSTISDKMEEFLNIQQKMMEGLSEGNNPFAVYQKLMEIPGFSMGTYKPFFEMQKLHFDNMQKFYNNYYANNLGVQDIFNFKNANEVFAKYNEYFSKYDYKKLFDPQASELMDKISNANKYYLQVYDFWNKLNHDFLNSLDIDSEKFNEFIEKNANMAYEMLTSILSDELKPFFDGPRELATKYFDIVANFYSPWKEDMQKLSDLFIKGTVENDHKKLAEFFSEWKKNYNATLGKIFSSPTVGLTKNLIEQQNKAFDKLIESFIVSAEFGTNLSNVQREAFKNIMKEYIELAKEGSKIKTFEEFYSFWSSKMDNYLINYFGSKEFSKLLGQFAETFMDFKIETNKLLEFYLADTPIVTVGKLDSMIKNIYNLKKEVKELKKEMKQLKEEKASKSK